MKHMVGLRRLFLILALIWSFVATMSPVLAQTVVSLQPGAAALDALQNAKANTIFELSGGDYGELRLKKIAGTADQPIVIRSKDAENPAIFRRMDLRETTHLILEGLHFDYVYDFADADNLRPFQLFTSRNVTLRNNLFDGDIADALDPETGGYPTAFGLTVRAATDIVIEDNEIRKFYRGITNRSVVGLTIRRNNIHSLRMDGMNFAQVEQVLIADNHVHDFLRAVDSADHADMIQFWTFRTERPSREITIRGNVLNSGQGWFTQSIFMRNEAVDKGQAGREMYYRDITIEDNVIINAHTHGITLGESDGVLIRNNTLIHNKVSDGKRQNTKLWRPRIVVAPKSENVDILSNVATEVVRPKDMPRSWTMAGNIAAQDLYPAQPHYYDRYFAAATTGDPRNLLSFQYKSDSPLSAHAAQSGAAIGADLLRDPLMHRDRLPRSVVLDNHTPLIQVRRDGQTPYLYHFTLVSPPVPGATYTWRLEGQLEQTGAAVSYQFDAPGKKEISVTLNKSGQDPVSASTPFIVKEREILSFDSKEGTFTSFAFQTPQVIDDIAPSSGPLHLSDDTGRTVKVPPLMIAPFFGSDGFELELSLQGEGGYKAAGELLRIHQVLVMTVNRSGSMTIDFRGADGNTARFTTAPIRMFDGHWVDLTLRYSAAERRIKLKAGDRVIGSAVANGPVPNMKHWGLSLGNPDGNRPSFMGYLNRLVLKSLS